jgi:hypothetical protein
MAMQAQMLQTKQ